MEANDLQANRARVAHLAARPWRMLIGGEMMGARGGECYATASPSTEAHLADVPFAGKSDVDDAVAAAAKA